MATSNEKLISDLIDDGVLKSESIINAFRAVDRINFVPQNQRAQAYANQPLPIQAGQTISQPLTVAIMLELLQPQSGERVLDVGAGSGWVAGLLAWLVGPAGQVIALERIPTLVQSAKENLKPFGFSNLKIQSGDGSRGWPGSAPYDCIHVAAAATSVPSSLPKQLAIGGRLIIPVGQPIQDLVLITKTRHNTFTEQRLPGFQFVPLIPEISHD